MRTRRGWLVAQDTALPVPGSRPSCRGLWRHVVAPKASRPVDLAALTVSCFSPCLLCQGLSFPPPLQPSLRQGFPLSPCCLGSGEGGELPPSPQRGPHPRGSGGPTRCCLHIRSLSLLGSTLGRPSPSPPPTTSKQPRAEPRAGTE